MLNLATSIGGQLINILLKFITRTVFIYTLGKAYLGINGLFSDILTMLSITELGFDTALNFKLYKPLAEKDYDRVRVLMKFYRQAYNMIGIVILSLGLCFIPLLPVLIRDYDTLEPLGINAALIFILYLLQSVSSYLFFAYKSAVVKADQKSYILNIADYVVTIVTCIVQILVLLLWKNFILYTATLILSNIVKSLVNATIAQKKYRTVFARTDDKLERAEVISLFKDCGALFVYRVNTVVVKATDNMVLSAFLGLATVGLYSNYLLIYTTIKSLLNRFFTAIKASMGNMYVVSNAEKRYQFFETINFISMILYGTACVGVIVVGDEFIRRWIGGDYVIPMPFAALFGTEILFLGIKMNLMQMRNISGAFRQMWFRPVLGIIVNLGSSVILVQVIGIYGVILGTIIADITTNFLVDPFIIYKYSLEGYRPVSAFYKKNGVYMLVLAVICAADYLICPLLLPGRGWLSVILHALICGITVPAGFMLVFCKTHEARYCLSMVRRLKNKLGKKKKG